MAHINCKLSLKQFVVSVWEIKMRFGRVEYGLHTSLSLLLLGCFEYVLLLRCVVLSLQYVRWVVKCFLVQFLYILLAL